MRLRLWHLAVFGAMTFYSAFTRPWWLTGIVLVAATIFFPVYEGDE